MATLNYTAPVKVVVTNLLSADNPEVLKMALTGTRLGNGGRKVMTLAAAKENGFTIYDYLLDSDGNFIMDAQEVPTADPTVTSIVGDNVLVVSRQAIKGYDRWVQFFVNQQKVLLAAGDSLEFEAKTAAEVAHFASLAVKDEIEVAINGVAVEPKTFDYMNQ